MIKKSKNFWFILLLIGLNCSEYNQNRNSVSETKAFEQKIMLEKCSQLDSLRQKFLEVDRFQTLKDSIILIETVVFSSHQFYNINLSESNFRFSNYYIDQRCNPILNPSMENPDSSCFILDNFRIVELSEEDKLKIIEIINRICKSDYETYGDVLDGISFEIKTNYLPKNLDIYLNNPKDSIFEELDIRLNQIGKK